MRWSSDLHIKAGLVISAVLMVGFVALAVYAHRWWNRQAKRLADEALLEQAAALARTLPPGIVGSPPGTSALAEPNGLLRWAEAIEPYLRQAGLHLQLLDPS